MNTKEYFFCVGIDLGSEYSQVSYCDYQNKEPVSVDFEGQTWRYRTPTVVSKTIGREEWFAGDEALHGAKLGEAVPVDNLLKKAADKKPVTVDDTSVMPIKLLEVYLDYLLQSAKSAGGSESVDRVCVTVEDYNISVLNVIVKAMENIGLSRDKLETSSRYESFIYYAVSQKEELWKNDVFLFDYDKAGLAVKRMYTANERGNRIIMVHTDSFYDELSYQVWENKLSAEYLDDKLYQLAMRLFDRKNISSVYLTGVVFADDINLPSFINYICDRRRVFAGNNLYCKGACYQAYAGVFGMPRDMILACRERITTGIEMKISDRGRDKILRMVRPGANWFGADCEYDFIVDNAEAVELFLSPIDSREKQLVRVPLTDFPERPGKTTRITVSLSFTSDSRCHVMVKDRGFGEFYASSGRVINEELLL